MKAKLQTRSLTSFIHTHKNDTNLSDVLSIYSLKETSSINKQIS